MGGKGGKVMGGLAVVGRAEVRRGSFKTICALFRTIKDYIANWNTDCKPFKWVATAEEILGKATLVEAQVLHLRDTSVPPPILKHVPS
jgi:hypothetical protein